jgi:hypothetical protein
MNEFTTGSSSSDKESELAQQRNCFIQCTLFLTEKIALPHIHPNKQEKCPCNPSVFGAYIG